MKMVHHTCSAGAGGACARGGSGTSATGDRVRAVGSVVKTKESDVESKVSWMKEYTCLSLDRRSRACPCFRGLCLSRLQLSSLCLLPVVRLLLNRSLLSGRRAHGWVVADAIMAYMRKGLVGLGLVFEVVLGMYLGGLWAVFC